MIDLGELPEPDIQVVMIGKDKNGDYITVTIGFLQGADPERIGKLTSLIAAKFFHNNTIQ